MEPASTLRQQVVAVLTQRGEAVTYRELTDAIWQAFPEVLRHFLSLYQTKQRARREIRVRLGILVKESPASFTATMSDGRVLVGLAATDLDQWEEEEEEEEEDAAASGGAMPAVYWYTFPAYLKGQGRFPIKVGKGNNAQARIAQQVTAMPEKAVILGTFAHPSASNLERALHAVLTLRGKRKEDAPGAEWFVTTSAEIEDIIKKVIGD